MMINYKTSKKTLIIFSLIIGGMVFLPASGNKIHLNEEFGFWIEFPEEWYFDESQVIMQPAPGINSGGIIAAIMHDGVNWWDHFVSVTLIKEDVTAINFEGDEFLDQVSTELTQACISSSFNFEGFECTEHKVLEKKLVDINGLPAYQIKESWIEIYSDGTNSSKISILTDIVVNNNIWQIDSINTASKFENQSDTIYEIINSFKFVETEQTLQHETKIPDWIKNNAAWWSQGLIGDNDFTSGIEFMINEGIIDVPLTKSQQNGDASIPLWVRNNAEWWSNGIISEDEFIGALQFLIQQGIISV